MPINSRTHPIRARTPARLKEKKKKNKKNYVGDDPRQEEREEEEEDERGGKGQQTDAVNSPFLEMLLHVSPPSPLHLRVKVCVSCVNRGQKEMKI